MQSDLDQRARAPLEGGARGHAGAKLDALIIQGANNLAGTGGYFRWFTGVSMGTSYPATVIFPKDGLMTLVSHGPMGVERDFAGKDAVWRGVGKWLPTASFPAIDYCIPYVFS